uniref:Uncharacterized protein n=1 Tax=Medicago truncatula TaxID=3880 RepID=Q1RU65_MEDTR|nr:hypothetical protein MtrDRAFT_AC153125g21v2 [Medicago truncatula]
MRNSPQPSSGMNYNRHTHSNPFIPISTLLNNKNHVQGAENTVSFSSSHKSYISNK